jgi:uncharacterized membrane protein
MADPSSTPGHSRQTTVLVWVSVACLFAYAGWAAATGRARLDMLPWNLFLAWIPFLIGAGIRWLAARTSHGTGILVLPTALWLLFFPNAPYIVTDVIHLRDSPPEYLVGDALIIGAFAALGLALAVASLGTVHAVVRARLGRTVGWVFVGAVAVLSGLGVWIGRVVRWNSWDLFTDPSGRLDSLAGALANPMAHVRPITFGVVFGLGLVFLYAVARMFRRERQPGR